MLLFSKIYEFYCLYGIEILLSGATGAARQNSYEGLHIFSYEELFTTFYHFLDRCITFSNFFQLFTNSSYEALIYILLTNPNLNMPKTVIMGALLEASGLKYSYMIFAWQISEFG